LKLRSAPVPHKGRNDRRDREIEKFNRGKADFKNSPTRQNQVLKRPPVLNQGTEEAEEIGRLRDRDRDHRKAAFKIDFLVSRNPVLRSLQRLIKEGGDLSDREIEILDSGQCKHPPPELIGQKRIKEVKSRSSVAGQQASAQKLSSRQSLAPRRPLAPNHGGGSLSGRSAQFSPAYCPASNPNGIPKFEFPFPSPPQWPPKPVSHRPQTLWERPGQYAGASSWYPKYIRTGGRKTRTACHLP
jgi:hypothetical protein